MPASRANTRADEIIEALSPLLAHHRRSWAARCHAHGLSITGFQVISLLEMNGPTPMTRLADELGVALPNATGIVTRLVDRGVVERGHDPRDRRVVQVQLTDDGRALIGEMEEARRARMRRVVGALDDAQQQRLIQSVRDLRAAALSLREEDDDTMEPAAT